jgi:hypothetical protein
MYRSRSDGSVTGWVSNARTKIERRATNDEKLIGS